MEASTKSKVSRAPNLSDQVTTMLRAEITNGTYQIGNVLPSEQAMSETFGVSRTVMREAISRLKAEGLVTTRQGLGVFVASNKTFPPFRLEGSGEDPSVVLKAVELRLGLEVEAAGRAADRHGTADLDDMKAALIEMALAIKMNDLEGGVEADLRFHRAICRATQNENFLNFFEFISKFLHNAIYMSRYRTARTKGQENSAQAEHGAIYDCIAKGDAEAARAAMRKHIENTASRIRSVSTSGE